ncbi:MAG: AAA family ATPase [Gemmatimonadaceae bacterium]
MEEGKVDLITISREFGSGGSELAQALGARLGWRVLDRDLVQLVAERLKLDPRTVAAIDEHPPGIFSRLSSALLITHPEWATSLDTSDVLSPDAIADATRAAILEAGQSPPVVVVGHGSQCLFHDRPATLHVRLVAPLQARVERICTREPCEGVTAVAQVRRMDTDRSAYVRRYYHNDWRDPLLYDMEINTGRVTIETAAALVVALVRSSA